MAGQPWESVGAFGGRGVRRPSGEGRCGCGVVAGVAPELEQVVGAAQQLPFGVAGGQPAAEEPAGALLVLELPKTGSTVCLRVA